MAIYARMYWLAHFDLESSLLANPQQRLSSLAGGRGDQCCGGLIGEDVRVRSERPFDVAWL